MKTITIELEDEDSQILEDGIVDPTEWLQNVVNVQVGKIKKRILLKEQTRLMASSRKTMPATMEGLVESYFSEPGYVNAAARWAAAQEEPDLIASMNVSGSNSE
jgi:hypothetical protein